MLQAMEPHLLLLIFLPIIGFSAAIAQEPHMLRKSWGQVSALQWHLPWGSWVAHNTGQQGGSLAAASWT